MCVWVIFFFAEVSVGGSAFSQKHSIPRSNSLPPCLCINEAVAGTLNQGEAMQIIAIEFLICRAVIGVSESHSHSVRWVLKLRLDPPHWAFSISLWFLSQRPARDPLSQVQAPTVAAVRDGRERRRWKHGSAGLGGGGGGGRGGGGGGSSSPCPKGGSGRVHPCLLPLSLANDSVMQISDNRKFV